MGPSLANTKLLWSVHGIARTIPELQNRRRSLLLRCLAVVADSLSTAAAGGVVQPLRSSSSRAKQPNRGGFLWTLAEVIHELLQPAWIIASVTLAVLFWVRIGK